MGDLGELGFDGYMDFSTRHLMLLGPQESFASLKQAIERLGLDRPLALITAGWEIDEEQDEHLVTAVGVPTHNLRLFGRSEELFVADTELISGLQSRQDELRQLRDVYRLRLDNSLNSVRQLLRIQEIDGCDLSPEIDSALDFVRQLDRQYFFRTGLICDHYEAQLQSNERPTVKKHREQLGEILSQCGGIIISGGNAAIILNRLRIFGVLDLAPSLPIIACSAGAMALAEQIVFFHDSPPQGPGNPEVLRAGLGVHCDVLPLPGAQERLRLNDRQRVLIFARRFHLYRCVVLNHLSLLERVDGQWQADPHSRQLSIDGSVREITE